MCTLTVEVNYLRDDRYRTQMAWQQIFEGSTTSSRVVLQGTAHVVGDGVLGYGFETHMIELNISLLPKEHSLIEHHSHQR